LKGYGSSALPPAVFASTPSSTMNPPPIEKNVLCSISLPPASTAVSRSPFGCRVFAPGGNIVSRRSRRSRTSSNSMSRLPASRSRFIARISAIVLSITAGSIEAGSFPASPSNTARSVPCPNPVSANDPYRSTCTRSTSSSLPLWSSSRANLHAARIGPIVCELEGPTPIL